MGAPQQRGEQKLLVAATNAFPCFPCPSPYGQVSICSVQPSPWPGGSPPKRRCGSMAKSTCPFSRSARRWKSFTDRANPKCGTGTGSPSTAQGRADSMLRLFFCSRFFAAAFLQPLFCRRCSGQQVQQAWGVRCCQHCLACTGIGRRARKATWHGVRAWAHLHCVIEPHCSRPLDVLPPAGWKARRGSTGGPAEIQPAALRRELLGHPSVHSLCSTLLHSSCSAVCRAPGAQRS